MNLSKSQMDFLTWVRRISFFRNDFIKDARKMGYGRDKSVALAHSEEFKSVDLLGLHDLAEAMTPGVSSRWLKAMGKRYEKSGGACENLPTPEDVAELAMAQKAWRTMDRDAAMDCWMKAGIPRSEAINYAFTDAFRKGDVVGCMQNWVPSKGFDEEKAAELSRMFSASADWMKIQSRSPRVKM